MPTLRLHQPLDSIDPKTIMAYVDMAQTQGKTGTFVKKVQIQNIPKGTILTQFNPTHFKVTINAPKKTAPAPKPQQ